MYPRESNTDKPEVGLGAQGGSSHTDKLEVGLGAQGGSSHTDKPEVGLGAKGESNAGKKDVGLGHKRIQMQKNQRWD
jgi:hypothetical protein